MKIDICICIWFSKLITYAANWWVRNAIRWQYQIYSYTYIIFICVSIFFIFIFFYKILNISTNIQTKYSIVNIISSNFFTLCIDFILFIFYLFIYFLFLQQCNNNTMVIFLCRLLHKFLPDKRQLVNVCQAGAPLANYIVFTYCHCHCHLLRLPSSPI